MAKKTPIRIKDLPLGTQVMTKKDNLSRCVMTITKHQNKNVFVSFVYYGTPYSLPVPEDSKMKAGKDGIYVFA